MRQQRMLLVRPEFSARKKFRDKKRYFRELQARAERYDLEDSPDVWWSFDHEHLDWLGRGNLSFRYRLETLRAHLILFRTIAVQIRRPQSEFQLFVSLSNEDAGTDAVNFHSPNPVSTFPYKLVRDEWTQIEPIPAVASISPSPFVWLQSAEWGLVGFSPSIGVELWS